MSAYDIENMVLWDKILQEARKVNELCKKRGIKDIVFTTANKELDPVYNRRRRGSETQEEYETRISR